MLLVEWTMDGTLYRISNEYLALEKPWKGVIKDFFVHYRINKNEGGYCKADVGNMSIIPSFFSTNSKWPPSINATVTIKQTTSNDTGSVTLMTGKAHWAGQERGSIYYSIHGPSYSVTIAKDKAWTTQTLNQIMSTICSSSMLNLTYSSSAARTPSPPINYTLKNDRLAIDFADDMCAYFSHLFYISGGTLYLVDMLSNNSSRSVGFKYFPPQYLAERPISSITATTRGIVTLVSTYPYGDELTLESFHSGTSQNSSALTDILGTLNKRRAELTLPSTVSQIKPGERLSCVDTRFPNDVTMKINARDIYYDWGRKRITVGGEGVMST